MYHCFCKNLVDKNGTDVANEYVFNGIQQDDNKLCAEWTAIVSRNFYLGWMIILLVSIISNGAELIIGYGSEYISAPRSFQ